MLPSTNKDLPPAVTYPSRNASLKGNLNCSLQINSSFPLDGKLFKNLSTYFIFIY